MADLLGRHAAVGVHHHDDVAGRGQEARPQCAAFADAFLGHHLDVGPVLRAVISVASVEFAVDEDDLVDVVGDLLEHPGDVAGLVSDRDDQADRRLVPTPLPTSVSCL